MTNRLNSKLNGKTPELNGKTPESTKNIESTFTSAKKINELKGETSKDLNIINPPEFDNEISSIFDSCKSNIKTIAYKFQQLGKDIYFYNINDKITKHMEKEYKNGIIYLDEKKRKILVPKQYIISNTKDINQLEHTIREVLENNKLNHFQKAQIMTYYSLFEKELSQRYKEVVVSEKVTEKNEDYYHIEDEINKKAKATSDSINYGIWDDYSIFKNLLYILGDKEISDKLLNNLESMRIKTPVSRFTKMIKGANYHVDQQDLFAMNFVENNKELLRNNLEEIMLLLFKKNPDFIVKISDKGVLQISDSTDNERRLNELLSVIDSDNNDNIRSYIKNQKKIIIKKDMVEIFDIFIYQTLNEIESEMDKKNVVKSYNIKSIVNKNIKLNSNTFQGINQGNNTKTNTNMNPFCNLTLNIEGVSLEIQFKQDISAYVSNIIDEYSNYLNVEYNASNNNKDKFQKDLNIASNNILKEKEAYRYRITDITKRLSKLNKEDCDYNHLQNVLKNTIKKYLFLKVVLINTDNQTNKSIKNDIKVANKQKEISAIVKNTLDKSYFKEITELLNSDDFINEVLKKRQMLYSKKFIELSVKDGKLDSFIYSIVNKCDQLNHPIYKLKTQFEFFVKLYFNTPFSTQHTEKDLEIFKLFMDHKIIKITQEIYSSIKNSDYTGGYLINEEELKDKMPMFNIDEKEFKQLISSKVVQEFLNNNSFINKTLKEQDESPVYKKIQYITDYLSKTYIKTK